MATGSAAGRKVSQPVEPIPRPWKIDPVSSREVIAGRTVIAYVHGDLAGQEYAIAAVIVRAVNAHDHLVAALKAISTHWANQYDHPNMEAPMYQGLYGTGVTDGHRACKAIADKALALLDGKDGAWTREGDEQMDAYWTDSANEMIAFLDPDNERQLHILKGHLIGLRNALKGTKFEAMEDRELATVAATAITLTRRRDAKN